ncbi:MAG: glycosyltransferase family 87 protein [Gemmataceae bacterium]
MSSCGLPARVSVRFVGTAVALVALNLANVRGHGYYSRTAALEALLALGVALAACLRRGTPTLRAPAWLGPTALIAALLILAPQSIRLNPWREKWANCLLVPGLLILGVQALRGRLRMAPAPMALLAVTALLLSGKALTLTNLLSGAPPAELAVLRLSAFVGFTLISWSAACDLTASGGCGRGFRLRLVLLFAAGAVLRVAPVMIWPEPPIDVFVWMREAPHVLLEGRNPYMPANMSQGELAVYPPLPILMTAPFALGSLDVRYANVVCYLLAALLLYCIARRLHRPGLGILVAGTYLNLPGVPFMFTYAWFEPMLAVLLAGGLFLLRKGNRLGHLMLAMALTGKQFGLPLFLPLWRALRGQRRSFLAGVGLAAALVILPFFLWSPTDFLNGVLYLHLAIGPDLHSLTLRSAAHHLLGLTIPGWFAAAATLVLISWVSWRAPLTRNGLGLWMATVLLTFCLLFVKGYFNYFYLCSFLFLLGLAELAPEGETAILGERATLGGRAPTIGKPERLAG